MPFLGLLLLAAAVPAPVISQRGRSGAYYGRLIGQLVEYAHGIRGTVYAVDESTVFVKGFSYDGTGPDAFFWVGNTPRPSPDGVIVPYPENYTGPEPPVLKAHIKNDIILRLPNNKKFKDIKWLSVWCRRFTVNFGEVFIPSGLEPPRSRALPEFKRLAHGLRSGNVTILDAKTFYIPNLHYDGAGPDAYFWVGNGSEPNPLGVKVPNEMGSLEPLRGYQGEDIEIQLPGDLTIHSIDWLAVWCVQYRHNFGHVLIPKDLDVPPALGQTKITTTSGETGGDGGGDGITNCRELLGGRLQVQWMIDHDYLQVTLSGRIREDQYMAFGISGEDGRSTMVGADVAVAFSQGDKFKVVDYYMSATAQCDGKNGVCPDTKRGGRDDVELISGERRNGVTTVTYKRPLSTNEPINDRPVPTDRPASVIAAIGPLNSRHEPNAHAVTDKTDDDIRLEFGRKDDAGCSNSLYNLPEDEQPQPWPPHMIYYEKIFTVRIGPTGGKRGYTPITGHPSWGIAYYINDLLIPELWVERGQTYTFIIEAGEDQTNPARYHPLYITDSSEGGFGQKSEEEQRRQRVFAGVSYDSEGYPLPTAAGRYCEWVHKTVDRSAEFDSFSDYFTTLKLECDDGEPAVMNWTVPMEAPDLLYYQCYQHNNLGWKINVVDPGTRRDALSGGPSMAGCVLAVTLATLLAALSS